MDRRSRAKDDLDDRDGRRRLDDRRRDRVDDPRRRDYDPRYPRDYIDRDRRRDDRRPRRYDDYDIRDPYYDDPYSRGYENSQCRSRYANITTCANILHECVVLDLDRPVDLLTTTEIEHTTCEREIPIMLTMVRSLLHA